jgi:hypothetical protein
VDIRLLLPRVRELIRNSSGVCLQPAAKAVKAPAKKEESSSEESDEDSEMEDAVS